MKINYIEKTPKKDLIESVRCLYEYSFPPEERRDFGLLLDIFKHKEVFKILVAHTDSDEFAGFLSFWDFGGFVYVEHFAVCPDLRGNGIGEHILRYFVKSVSKPVVLEVEPPIKGDMTERRVAFYIRNGALLHDGIQYTQPAYSPELSPVELKLMSFGEIDESQFPEIIRTIHKEVYGVENNR